MCPRTFAPGLRSRRPTTLPSPFIHAIEGHHPESDGVREELILSFTATDDMSALASALTTAANLMEGTYP